jgi:hypothetical protein
VERGAPRRIEAQGGGWVGADTVPVTQRAPSTPGGSTSKSLVPRRSIGRSSSVTDAGASASIRTASAIPKSMSL